MRNSFFLFFFFCLVSLSGCALFATTPEVSDSSNDDTTYATAVFAGGCFWCVESAFEKYDGVIDAVSGYAGDDTGKPTYEDVGSGKTTYVEAVEVHYDPAIIRYSDLLAIYWRQINPTDDGGSFVDRGTQYRSIIFYANNSEQMLAEATKHDLENPGMYEGPLVTQILPLAAFYRAEEYHQDYYKKNPVHYQSYRSGSGRDQYREKIWGEDKDYHLPKRLSKEELTQVLTPLQYQVTQEGGTEPPFHNEYWDNKDEGVYVDLISGKPLFSSKDKFVSGTGWPSFTKPIREGVVVRVTDTLLGFPRTEIKGAVSDAHLGHVFDDGPKPTGLRYCMNSSALNFVPLDKLEEEGLSEFLVDFNK